MTTSASTLAQSSGRKRPSEDTEFPPLSSTYFSSSSSAAAAATASPTNVRNFEKLAECELNSRVRFNKNRECIEFATVKPNGKLVWKPVSGLIDRLHENFYPQYDYLRSRQLARRGGGGDNVEKPAHPALLQEKKRLGKRAMELGELVDREHSEIINRSLSTTEAAAAATTSSPSLFTRILLNVKKSWHWTSYMAQFTVCAPDIGVGTRIDEICYDEHHQLLVIEHKVGYKDYRNHGTAMMNEPLQDVSNAPENQHSLQCLFGVLMLEKYWNVTVHGAFVVYIDDAEVVPVALPEVFWERKEAIWNRFVEQINRRFR